MTKTLFITGASSGIGKATAIYFAGKGWNVAATMRNPAGVPDLPERGNLKKFRLDVQDEENIRQTITAAIKAFGRIDVLVNNAGYGAMGPFEQATRDQIRRQFDVNVFGMMNVTRGLLPHFRGNKAGRIVNISSMGGRTTFPYFQLYHASKFAVEGFSESLNYELNPLGIDVKLVEPGGVRTDFGGRSLDWLEGNIPEYQEAVAKLKNVFSNLSPSMVPSVAEDIAKVIYEAATVKSARIRWVAGRDAKMILAMRKIVGVPRLMKIVKHQLKV